MTVGRVVRGQVQKWLVAVCLVLELIQFAVLPFRVA